MIGGNENEKICFWNLLTFFIRSSHVLLISRKKDPTYTFSGTPVIFGALE